MTDHRFEAGAADWLKGLTLEELAEARHLQAETARLAAERERVTDALRRLRTRGLIRYRRRTAALAAAP